MNAAQVWRPYDSCPCGCGEIGWKLRHKTGHVPDCRCDGCLYSRNGSTGRAAHERMHTNLGGSGKPGWHEERARPYTIEVEVMPESKTGAQVPAAFHKFTDSRWFKGALYQSAMAVPVGSGVVPAVVIDGRWLIADIEPRTKR